MIRVEPLGSEHAVALAELASSDDVVRFGDHLATDPPKSWEAWIGPPDADRAVTLAAREGSTLVAAAKLTLPTRRRRHHTAQLALVASDERDDAAVAALLDAAIDTCDRWLHVDRVELAAPADHPRVAGLFSERGFEVEVRRRHSLRTAGALVDEVGLARLRDGAATGARTAETLALPVPPSAPRPAVTTRRIRPADGAVVAAMMGEPSVVHGTLQTPHQRPEGMTARIDESDPSQIVFLGAEVEGALVGTGALMLNRPLRRRHAGSIGMMVSDAFQGRGVGRALLGALLGAADEIGLARVELGVYPDNARAVRLYESAGFEHEGRHRLSCFRDGVYVDDLAMARLRPER